MLIRFNKPYGVLSQFTPEGRWRGLKDHIDLPGVYVAGRLDADSEGLLLLTDDGPMQARIADPRFKMEKTYLVQVEGMVTQAALNQLSRGVTLNDGPTLPAFAIAVDPHRRGALQPGWPAHEYLAASLSPGHWLAPKRRRCPATSCTIAHLSTPREPPCLNC